MTPIEIHTSFIQPKGTDVQPAPLTERYPVCFGLWYTYNIYSSITVLSPLAFVLTLCVNCHGLLLIAS